MKWTQKFFEECAIFAGRIKTIVSQKFPRITNTISEPQISQVTDMHVTAELYHALWPDKPRIVWCYKINMF